VALPIFAHRLPVDGRGLGPDSPGRHHLGGPVIREFCLHGPEKLCDGGLRAALAEAYEDEAHPDFEVERRQAEFVLVEVGEGTRPRSASQRASQIVNPAMEGAHQRILAIALLGGDDARTAVPAHVVEGAYDAVL